MFMFEEFSIEALKREIQNYCDKKYNTQFRIDENGEA